MVKGHADVPAIRDVQPEFILKGHGETRRLLTCGPLSASDSGCVFPEGRDRKDGVTDAAPEVRAQRQTQN